MVTRRSATLGPDARPVSIPDDIADTSVDKAHGRVELPLHVRWSGASKVYDLGRRRDRRRVYEQILSEGNEDDVRRFIDLDQLLELWEELALPRRVRRAWAEWYWQHRGIQLSC